MNDDYMRNKAKDIMDRVEKEMMIICSKCGKELKSTFGVFQCCGITAPLESVHRGPEYGSDKELYMRVNITRKTPDPVTGNKIFQGNLPIGKLLIKCLKNRGFFMALNPAIRSLICKNFQVGFDVQPGDLEEIE